MPTIHQQSFYHWSVNGQNWGFHGVLLFAELRRIGYRYAHLFDSNGKDRGIVAI